MKPNEGELPLEARGKRVRVTLRNGTMSGPWPADGRGGCNWTLDRAKRYPFDIVAYEVVE